MSVLDRKQLEESPLADLHTIAAELGVEGYRRLRREELINVLMGGEAPPAPEPADEPDEEETREERMEEVALGEDGAAERAEERAPKTEDRDTEADEVRSGVLDILPNGSGFLRADPFAHSREDVYVSPAQIRRCELRSGDEVTGPVRKPRRSERHPSLIRVDTVNGQPAEPPQERADFRDLTPVFPTERLDLPAPAAIARGSRVAVAGPPGAGATRLLREIAGALSERYPDLDLTVVLVGVRPEEATEWRESGLTVVGGGFDRPHEEQAQIAEMALERAKRRVEAGGHAAILLDSLDALPQGTARRIFGGARKTREGGSLTVIAATGSAGEPLRQATTRIVLDGAPESGTLREDLLQ